MKYSDEYEQHSLKLIIYRQLCDIATHVKQAQNIWQSEFALVRSSGYLQTSRRKRARPTGSEVAIYRKNEEGSQ